MTVRPGSLVIWSGDRRYPAARHCYVVLGQTEKDRDGRPQFRIACAHRTNQPVSHAEQIAKASEIRLLADFGVSIHALLVMQYSHGGVIHSLQLQIDEFHPGAKHWGGRMGGLWETGLMATISDEGHYRLIHREMLHAVDDGRRSVAASIEVNAGTC